MVGGHHPLRVTASGPVTADNPARSQTERAFTRTLRVAAVLALTEERSVMTADDLDCALAFVNYSIASARYVIGASTDKIVVERFQAAIQAAACTWVSPSRRDEAVPVSRDWAVRPY